MHGLILTLGLISTVVTAPTGAAALGTPTADAAATTLAQNAPTAPPPAAMPPPMPPPPPPAPGEGVTRLSAPPPPLPDAGSAPAIRGASVWGVIPAGYNYYGYGFGIGGSFIMPMGFPTFMKRGRLHDIWAIEGGADLWHFSFDYYCGGLANCGSSENWLVPYANVMWQLWLTDTFGVYPKAGLAVPIVVSGGCNGIGCSNPFPLRPNVGAGLIYRIGPGIMLRAEIGYEGLKGGVGFVF